MRIFGSFIVTTFIWSMTFAQGPALGEMAPDFSLRYATKDSIASSPLILSKETGKNVVILAFYPADWSSGCTKEVCALRDDFGNLRKLNADVLGASGDYVYSHFEWAKHHELPFRLLSDHNHAVATAYASFNESTGYNRRTVFVIDRAGKLAYADLEYSVRDSQDFDRLKQAVAELP